MIMGDDIIRTAYIYHLQYENWLGFAYMLGEDSVVCIVMIFKIQ